VTAVSIWTTLGVARTTDQTEIRRAYSRRLKVTNPEDDAEGFQALRNAYERAMAEAARAQARAPQTAPSAPPIASPASRQTSIPPDVTGETGPAPADGGVKAQAPQSIARSGLQTSEPTAPHDTAPGGETTPSKPDLTLSVIQADIEAYNGHARNLVNAVTTPSPDPEAAKVALAKLLASPALDAIAIRDRTEGWLASFILGNAPRADLLIETVVEHYNWERPGIGPIDPARQAILARLADLRFLAGIKRQGSTHYRAYRALTAKLTRWSFWRNRTALGLEADVRHLLEIADRRHRTLINDFDPEAAAWWRRYLSTPQFGAGLIWTTFLAPIIPSIALVASPAIPASPFAWPETYALCVIATFAPLAVWTYGLLRPRAKWRVSAQSASWFTLGWAPSALAIFIASALIAPSLWATWPLAAASVAILGWSFVTGEFDRTPSLGVTSSLTRHRSARRVHLFQLILTPGVSLIWQAKALFSYLYLAIFWISMSSNMPWATWLQMSAPLLAATGASILGAQSLDRAWRGKLSAAARRWCLRGLAAAVALTPLLLWWTAPGWSLVPIAAALVATQVIIHKTVTAQLADRAYLLRDVIMRYGWIIWFVVGYAACEQVHQGDATLFVRGTWLLAGVAAGLIGMLRAEHLASRAGAG